MSSENEVEQGLGSEEQSSEQAPSIKSAMSKAMIGLGLFAVLTAGLIALTQVSTKDVIAEQKRLAKSKALLEIVPAEQHDNDLLADAYSLMAAELGLSEAEQVFVAKLDNSTQALILPLVAPDGYSGNIRLIVGLDLSGQILGVRVVEHKETPGLGDKIETKKSDWIHAFVGRSLANTTTQQWGVKADGGDFDQMTGATITPRAIVNAVHRALQFYQTNQVQLLNTPAGASIDLTEARNG